MLSAFSWIIEVRGKRLVAFPLVVIGMNSLAAYLMAHLREEFLENSMHTCRNAGAEYTRQQSRATCARHPGAGCLLSGSTVDVTGPDLHSLEKQSCRSWCVAA